MITVADKNEHAPQFTSSSYFGQIFIGNPDSQIGTDESLEKVVVRVRATDRDFGENARIFYSIGTGMDVMDNKLDYGHIARAYLKFISDLI